MIEVGEYVRTTQGYIAKCVEIDENTECFDFDGTIRKEFGEDFDDLYGTRIKSITKHSKNIIDLIEVGDYVNGYKIDIKESTLLITKAEGIDRSGYTLPISQYGENIKSILTHEQYDANCYKIGE